MPEPSSASIAGSGLAPRNPEPPDVVHVRPDRPADVPFLLERSPQRMGRAFGVSVLSHGAVIALFLAIIALSPVGPRSNPFAGQARNYDIVWIPQEGPGGGGGGGGNLTPEPPRKVELPGKDKLTVPVVKPPDLEPAKKEQPEPPPIEQMNIPALAMAQGAQTLPGALEGLSAVEITSQGPGSGGGAGTGRGTGVGPGEGSGLGPGSGGGTGGGVYRPGSGVTIPRPIREIKPQYTSEAMRAKIQGEVWLEAVVLPDGTVGNVEIVRSLDAVFGLDQEALKAARQWRFVPGSRLGQPVPVLVTISMTFTLR